MSKTCNEAVRVDMGLDTLQGRRDKNMLKWWYKLAALPGNRYLKNRNGILSHGEAGRGSVGVTSLMMSFCHQVLTR